MAEDSRGETGPLKQRKCPRLRAGGEVSSGVDGVSLVAVRDLWTDPVVVAGRLKRVRNDRWGKGRRWQVRWRDADQVQRKRNFSTADGAEAFWAELQLSPRERARRRTVAEQYELWLSAKTVKASTRADYEQKWRLRVSEFGPRQVASLTHAEIAQWVGEMSRAVSASTTRRAFIVLSGVLDMAVRDGVIAANPCAGVRLPRLERGEMRFLTMGQVRRLAEECAPHGLVVWTLALTGIRWGELCALEPNDLDGGRLRVARSVSEVGGELVLSTPKSGRGRDWRSPRGWLRSWRRSRASGCSPRRGGIGGGSRHGSGSGARTGSTASRWMGRSSVPDCTDCGCTTCDTPMPRSPSRQARM